MRAVTRVVQRAAGVQPQLGRLHRRALQRFAVQRERRRGFTAGSRQVAMPRNLRRSQARREHHVAVADAFGFLANGVDLR